MAATTQCVARYNVYTCPQCQRRRRIYTVDIVGTLHNMRCSQGHTWTNNFAKLNQLMKDIWVESIMHTINDDTPLVAYMKRAS